MDTATIATYITAAAGVTISYLLQKPYVRVVKLFANGSRNYSCYKLKNAGAATALCIVLQDKNGNAIDLDLKLGQDCRYVDALGQGAEITVLVPDKSIPTVAYYENLFGLLFCTELTEAGNRFRMSARKVWPLFDSVPKAVSSELPHHWWRRH